MSKPTTAPTIELAWQTAGCVTDEMILLLSAFGRKHAEIIRLEVFGSVARGEAQAQSDVDVAATFAPAWKRAIGGFAYFGYLADLEEELAAVLGRRVHVVDRAGVESSARIGNVTLAQAIARDGKLVYESDGPTT